MSAEVVPINRDAVLRAVGLNVNDPNAQALLLVCERYGLDPLLKHMVLIQQRPYITRDGYLSVAHASKQLDGIETVEEGETQTHWWAKVAVYRKDMAHPFTYKGRYPKSGSNKSYGPEMALKCAEVAALRRAFNVTGAGAADERWDTEDEHTTVGVAMPTEANASSTPDVTDERGELGRAPGPAVQGEAVPSPTAASPDLPKEFQGLTADDVDKLAPPKIAKLLTTLNATDAQGTLDALRARVKRELGL